MKRLVNIREHIVGTGELSQLRQTLFHVLAHHFFVFRVIHTDLWSLIADKVLMSMRHKIYLKAFTLEELHDVIAFGAFAIAYPDIAYTMST